MEDETFIERWISEQQHDEQQRRIIDHLKEKCKNQYIQQLNAINAVNNYYPFGNYVQDIYQSLTNYSNCHPTIYHISVDICVLITEYIFDPFSPNINRHVYEFNRHGQQEPKQLKYDTLPKLEDFIDYVLFSDHGIWAPSDYLYPEPFEHFSAWYAIQDYGLLNGSQCPLNIIDYEFVNAKCNNINYYYNYMNEYKIKWKHEFKQQSQLIDYMTNECIIKIELCELYHCSKVMTDGLSSRGSYIRKHHIVGKVKYKTTNSTELFAYLWIEFDSDYDKYAWIRNRVLRKHWIDLYDILIQNCYSGYVAIDCYAFLGDEYSFINSKQIWNQICDLGGSFEIENNHEISLGNYLDQRTMSKIFD